MRTRHWSRWLAILLAFAMFTVACGSDDDDGDTAEPTEADAGGDDADAGDADADTDDGGDDADADAGGDDADAGDDSGDADTASGTDLSGVCPSPLVIQTDWFAEAEHGALYELIGDGYTVDSDNLVVSGPGQLGGEPLGIDIEVRSGGPAIGFAAPRVQMYTDDSIHLGYTSTDQQATAWDELPLISVIAPLEINPQIIMWDADTYPDVKTIADVGEAGITVNLFSRAGFAEAFVAQGIWTDDQVDPSYDGGPSRFVAEGDIAQQGFASAEPFNYEFVFEEYGKAPAFQLLHDSGWQVYSQSIGVKPDDLEEMRPCLEPLVPIIQQAILDYANDPGRANAIIVDAVDQFDSFWVYTAELAEWSVGQQAALGLVGNGPDSTVGNMEADRIQAILDAQRGAGIEIPDDLTAEDMFTNEFIDESLGFPDGFGGGGAAPEAEPASVDLSGVCPSPLVIQTDWFAEAEHGALYELIGDGYTVDSDNLVVSGPGQLGGEPLGIDIEVRSGGPAIGFAAPRVQMYTDDSIHLGYTSTDQQATAWDELPLISVIAPLEINPQIIMWDADTYPDVKTIQPTSAMRASRSTCSHEPGLPRHSWPRESGPTIRSIRPMTVVRRGLSPRATLLSRALHRPSRSTTSSSSRSTARHPPSSCSTIPDGRSIASRSASSPMTSKKCDPASNHWSRSFSKRLSTTRTTLVGPMRSSLTPSTSSTRSGSTPQNSPNGPSASKPRTRSGRQRWRWCSRQHGS